MSLSPDLSKQFIDGLAEYLYWNYEEDDLHVNRSIESLKRLIKEYNTRHFHGVLLAPMSQEDFDNDKYA